MLTEPTAVSGRVAWIPAVGVSRWTGLDSLIGFALLILTLSLFMEAVWENGKVPFGLDMVQHYSREAFNRHAMQQTWVPLWNPYAFSGFPAQADPQTGVFYPPSMLLRLFSLPTFLTWTVVFHVWLFGIGGYALCRTLGVGRAAAALGGAALLLGGITMPRVYAGHLDVLRTVSWVPLVLTAAMRSLDRGEVRPTGIAVFMLALQVLGGFLQLVVYTFGVVLLYAAFSAGWPDRGVATWLRTRRIAMQSGLLVVLVLGITAFQLLPTARLITAAGRTSGMSYGAAVDAPLLLRDLPRAMFMPERTGEVQPESWESTTYVGWLPAVLAPLGLIVARRQRRVVFMGLVGALALTLGMGSPLYKLHYLAFPMFRIPGRFFCFWAIAVAVWGVVALDWLASRYVVAEVSPRLRWRSAILMIAAGLIVLVDGIGYGHHFVRVEPISGRFTTALPFTPTLHGRVLSLCENLLLPGEISALGVPSVDGYNSYFLGDYARLARKVLGDETSEQSLGFPRMAVRLPENVNVVSALNVTDVVSCEPVALPGLVPVGEREGLYLYKNIGALGRAALRCELGGLPLDEWALTCNDPMATIRVLEADTSTGVLRLYVSLSEARTLVLSEPFYPERRAWVDGIATPLEKANIALSSVRVGAGSHVVKLRYVPTSLLWGSVISVAVLLLWAAVACGCRPKCVGAAWRLGGRSANTTVVSPSRPGPRRLDHVGVLPVERAHYGPDT